MARTVSWPASARRLAMHHPYDDLAKKVGKGALSASGPTTVEHAVSRSTQRADIRHDPDPARAAERARLGLLGRIAEVLCLIEVFGHAPDGGEWRGCLIKHFAHWEERRRKASELPRDRSTLLVRIMAAGPLLPDAIAELAALPGDAIERGLVEGAVVDLDRVLGQKPSRTAEEEEIVAMLQGTFTEARRMGRDEGEAAASARAVLTVLRVRGIAVSDADRERILAEKDPARLERWHERAILAASVAEVFDEANRMA